MKRKIPLTEKIDNFACKLMAYCFIISIICILPTLIETIFPIPTEFKKAVSLLIFTKIFLISFSMGVFIFVGFIIRITIKYHIAKIKYLSKIPQYDIFEKYKHIKSIKQLCKSLSLEELNLIKFQKNKIKFIKNLIKNEEDEYLKRHYKKTKTLKMLTDTDEDIDKITLKIELDAINDIENTVY